jgi:hypothetical protein
MEVKAVEAALGSIDGKLNLVLHFVVLDRLSTDGRRHTARRTPVRPTWGQAGVEVAPRSGWPRGSQCGAGADAHGAAGVHPLQAPTDACYPMTCRG